MKNKKLTMVSVFVVLLIGTVGYCIQTNRHTYSKTINEEEVGKAYQLLNASFSRKSVRYIDFKEKARAVGQGENTAYPQGGVTLEGYEGLGICLKYNEAVRYEVEANCTGIYQLLLDYKPLKTSLSDFIISLEVNGEQQFMEMNNITLPLYWKDSTKFFPEDQFGNQTSPEPIRITDWRSLPLYDNTYASAAPLGILLKKGKNTIIIKNLSSDCLSVGRLTATATTDAISYEEYKNKHKGKSKDVIYMINSNDYLYKNTLQARYFMINNSALTPHVSNRKLINVLSWNAPGTEVTYKIITPNDGLYKMAFHYQNKKEEMSVYETIRIDGEVPFAELLNYAFPSTSGKWNKEVLSNEEGNPYLIYLSKGQHTISLRSDLEPIAKLISYTSLITEHIMKLDTDITKILTGTKDINHTINMNHYIPEITDYIKAYETLIFYIKYKLTEHMDKRSGSDIMSDLNKASAYIKKIQNNTDNIVAFRAYLSGKEDSLLKVLGGFNDILKEQNFSLDMIYLFGGDKLPAPNPPIFRSLRNDIQDQSNNPMSIYDVVSQ